MSFGHLQTNRLYQRGFPIIEVSVRGDLSVPGIFIRQLPWSVIGKGR